MHFPAPGVDYSAECSVHLANESSHRLAPRSLWSQRRVLSSVLVLRSRNSLNGKFLFSIHTLCRSPRNQRHHERALKAQAHSYSAATAITLIITETMRSLKLSACDRDLSLMTYSDCLNLQDIWPMTKQNHGELLNECEPEN